MSTLNEVVLMALTAKGEFDLPWTDEPVNDVKPRPDIEAFIERWKKRDGLEFIVGGEEYSRDGKKGNSSPFYYDREENKVHIPDMRRMKSQDEYYAALFHELTHWTGHKSRLNRASIYEGAADIFGNTNRAVAVEDATAELGAFLLCKEFGIDRTKAAAEYAANWMRQAPDITEKMLALIEAMVNARKAAAFLLQEK